LSALLAIRHLLTTYFSLAGKAHFIETFDHQVIISPQRWKATLVNKL